ncbi:MAG TPA: MOSC domain-containing protein [Candidatus Anaerobutyricum avicola]|nr:MOSC domain-containing protein [Candidatus Anaerobutyricum avicola]
MGIIRGICISEKRGTQKTEVPEADLKVNWGIEGDAHGGSWHRQVSLLSLEKIEAFREKGADVAFGAFGENLIVEGFDFASLPVGSRFRIGEAELEMTQIGKECHSHCQIYQVMGDCIMPREGVFAEVRKSGHIRVGDAVTLLPQDPARPLTAAVITLSDKGAAGQREDKSGPVIVEELKKAGYKVIETLLLPDDMAKIKAQLIRLSDQRQVNLILTTGGTGFSERDCTPEATLAVATRNAPGIAEAIRAGSMQITRRAMLSREASVIRNQTLIVNLPGSPKAVKECLDLVLDQLDHGIRILTGRDSECARK